MQFHFCRFVNLLEKPEKNHLSFCAHTRLNRQQSIPIIIKLMRIDYISIFSFFFFPPPIAGYFVVSDMKVNWGPNVQKHQYYDLLKKYWLIIIIAVVTVIAALLMPLIGLCFCCCRCAGACGGRSQPFDKKHDTCRRFMLGFCLLLVASSMV